MVNGGVLIEQKLIVNGLFPDHESSTTMSEKRNDALVGAV
jgi:hypothetical protein